MGTVFVVQHLRILAHGAEDLKLIGVYTTREEAESAIARLKTVPGFRSFPHLINPWNGGPGEGFYIGEYVLNHDYWMEGFSTRG